MRIFDISMPLGNDSPVWPGDVPWEYRLSWARAQGASVNVGVVTSSVHNGTHVDAPFHFDDAGVTTDDLQLERYLGPASVLHVPAVDPLGIDALASAARRTGLELGSEPRLLLRTDAWPDRSAFPRRIPVLTIEAAERLGALGVRLLGVDLPSVDRLDDEALPIHRALDRADVRILENLLLDAVAPGRYELIALPLRIVGGDGSPVRAVLRG